MSGKPFKEKQPITTKPGEYNVLFKTTNLNEILLSLNRSNYINKNFIPLSRLSQEQRTRLKGYGTEPEEKRI